jgi:hypothetical protein
MVGLRFRKSQARVLRNIATDLRSLQPEGVDISLFDKAAESAAAARASAAKRAAFESAFDLGADALGLPPKKLALVLRRLFSVMNSTGATLADAEAMLAELAARSPSPSASAAGRS